MAGESGAYAGRSVTVAYSLSQDNTTVPNDFVLLGAVRNHEWGPEWDTIDATAADSPNLQRETLTSYQSFNVSLNGVSRTEEIKAQDDLEDYITIPANDQPCGWVQITRPSNENGAAAKIYYIPVIFQSFRISAPYEDVTTWTLEAPSNGRVVTEYA